MTSNQIIPSPPPVNNPSNSQLGVWASAVTVFLRTISFKERTPTKLAYKNDDSKASEDGILMYDPSTDHVVVSISGEWKKLEFAP